MRVSNCAECQREIAYGEILFAVYWSVDPVDIDQLQLYYICKECMQSHLREGNVPGGRV